MCQITPRIPLFRPVACLACQTRWYQRANRVASDKAADWPRFFSGLSRSAQERERGADGARPPSIGGVCLRPVAGQSGVGASQPLWHQHQANMYEYGALVGAERPRQDASLLGAMQRLGTSAR